MAMTYDSVVQATRKKFLNTDVSSVQGTLAFQINLIGKVEGIFYIEIKDGQVHKTSFKRFNNKSSCATASPDSIASFETVKSSIFS